MITELYTWVQGRILCRKEEGEGEGGSIVRAARMAGKRMITERKQGWKSRQSQIDKDTPNIMKEARKDGEEDGHSQTSSVSDTVAHPLSTTPGSLSHKLLRLILSCDLSRWGFGVTSEWDIKKERRGSEGERGWSVGGGG